jgi:hypothetical protein
MTKPIIIKARKAPKAYNLDPEKLKGASQSILPYLFGGNLYYSEDYEYFDKIRPYLDIPEPPKSIEELQQELDEKFEELLVKTKRKFAVSKESAEYHYNQFCKKQDGDFEYAKTQGYFPKLTIGTIGGTLDGSYLLANNFVSSNFVLKPDSLGAGYWEIKPNIQIWLEKKPNWLVRKCAKIFFDFGWKDA